MPRLGGHFDLTDDPATDLAISQNIGNAIGRGIAHRQNKKEQMSLDEKFEAEKKRQEFANMELVSITSTANREDWDGGRTLDAILKIPGIADNKLFQYMQEQYVKKSLQRSMVPEYDMTPPEGMVVSDVRYDAYGNRVPSFSTPDSSGIPYGVDPEQYAAANRAKVERTIAGPQDQQGMRYITAYKDGKPVPLQIPEAEYNQTISSLQGKGWTFSEPDAPSIPYGVSSSDYAAANRAKTQRDIQGQQPDIPYGVDPKQYAAANQARTQRFIEGEQPNIPYGVSANDYGTANRAVNQRKIAPEERDIESTLRYLNSRLNRTYHYQGQVYDEPPTPQEVQALQHIANQIGYKIQKIEVPVKYDRRNWLGLKRKTPKVTETRTQYTLAPKGGSFQPPRELADLWETMNEEERITALQLIDEGVPITEIRKALKNG